MTVSIGNGVSTGNIVTSEVNQLTGGIEVSAGGKSLVLATLDNMQSSTPISLTGTTAQKALIIARIPAEKLFPRCRIQAEFEFSRNRTGANSVTYTIELNDHLAVDTGQGGQTISTVPMTTTQYTRRETMSVLIGDDLRHQKFLQNNASNGGVGNLNKYVDTRYNGNKGLSLTVSATLTDATDVLTIESYKIEVTK